MQHLDTLLNHLPDTPARRGRPATYAKGDAVRALVLEMTITCLAELPYSAVSASVIADRVGVSRGGMQHHFPTRLALLQATVEHLHARRLNNFRDDMVAIPQGADMAAHLVDTHWRHLNEREFRAYQELVLAGRSEPDLARVLSAKYPFFLQEWLEVGRTVFNWNYADPDVALAGNIVHSLMEGMAFGVLGGQLTSTTVTDLLNYSKTILREGLMRSS